MHNLKKRYPDLAFLLSFFPKDKTTLRKKFEQIPLNEVDIYYCIGLVDAPLPPDITEWLEGSEERALVLVDDRLGAFASYSHDEVLLNPKVHFVYAEKIDVEALASAFPTDRLAISVETGRDFAPIELKRRSAAYWAIYSDILYSYKIVKNVVTHFRRLPGCFDGMALKGAFTRVPAIICGAGPSLDQVKEQLRALRDRALIIAGGSAIPALSKMGITPHLAIALDPNSEELTRFQASTQFTGPFLFAPRLQKDVFASMAGPFAYLRTDTGGLIESWLENELAITTEEIGGNLGSEAFSVTTLALSYIQALGCKQIAFVGVDLAYTDGKRYAANMKGEEESPTDPRALEQRVVRPGVKGDVDTLLKWVMEADTIGTFAQKHPEHEYINATGGGLGLPGIRNGTLSELQTTPFDIDGLIHQKLITAPMLLDPKTLEEALTRLDQSLDRAKENIQTILQDKESPLAILAESDLEEEPCYAALLSGIDAALTNLLSRSDQLAVSDAKYKELLMQIDRMKSSIKPPLIGNLTARI